MMKALMGDLLSGAGFIPHGYCIAWDPLLLWSTVIANLLIGLAYYSIPVTIYFFLRRQPDIRFPWLFWMFGLFILACGTTHFIHVLNIWVPVYRLDAAALSVTAGISVATAVMLWPLVPRVNAYLSARRTTEADLRLAYAQLAQSTEQIRQRRQEAEQSERRFRQAMESAPIGMAIVALDGRLLSVNRAFGDMLGYPPEQLQALRYQDITYAEDLPIDIDLAEAVRDGRRPSYQIEKRYIHRNGALIVAQLDVTLIRDEDGQPLHFLSQVQDISRRKQLDQDLRASKAQLEHSVAELRRTNGEIKTLSELSALLQACNALTETVAPLGRYGGELFRGLSGSIHLLSSSGNYLEHLAGWGDQDFGAKVFAPEHCWGLRRGQAHWSDHRDGLHCLHLHPREQIAAGQVRCLCQPLIAYGELLGVVSLHWQSDRPLELVAEGEEQLLRLVGVFEDRVGIGLANIRMRQNLRAQSIRDGLTGLLNRRYLEETLPRELAEARRSGAALSALMIDVDHFKQFNDRHGHEAGDHVLRQVALTLEAQFRGSDIACRYGGEEFAVIMPATALEQARTKAEALRRTVAALRLSHRDQPLSPVKLSIGVASVGSAECSSSELLQRADQALYAAKRSGRDRVVSQDEVPEAS